jgi:hypothetical protein
MMLRWMRPAGACGTIVLALAMLSTNAAAKKPKAAAPDPETQGPALQTLSLRINTLDLLYQLDLSPDQLVAFRSAAIGAADTQPRANAKPNEKLADLFTKMQAALLAGTDDQAITTLRNQIVDLVNSGGIEMEDSVRPTPLARANAVGLCTKLKASQIAAFIALHADEVGDPQEIMMSALSAVRDAKESPEPGDDPATISQEAATSVGQLVAGTDIIKVKAIADQVTAWLRTGAAISEADLPARHAALEADAHKIVAVAGPMDVLTHWMQHQIAIVLSNPETDHAIDLLQASHKTATP